jgi:hypothetical protein
VSALNEVPRHEDVLGEWHAFLTLAPNVAEWSASHPRSFTPKERAPGTHWLGSWVGPRTGLNEEAKNKTPTLLLLGIELLPF